MNNLTAYIKDELLCHGADLVGIGDLMEFAPEQRWGLPFGIAIAVKYPGDIIKGIIDMPNLAYYEQYKHLNQKLEMLTALGAQALRALSYEAVGNPPAFMEDSRTFYNTTIPHKTVATRAGLGWIGKCALLVTKEYGSAVRIAPIFTNAPLKAAEPINKSKCGDCMQCVIACPAGAVLGKNWSVDIHRDEIFNADFCRKAARERSMMGFGVDITLCGRCIAACPYTQKYLNKQ